MRDMGVKTVKSARVEYADTRARTARTKLMSWVDLVGDSLAYPRWRLSSLSGMHVLCGQLRESEDGIDSLYNTWYCFFGSQSTRRNMNSVYQLLFPSSLQPT